MAEKILYDFEAMPNSWQDRAGVVAEYNPAPIFSEPIIKLRELEKICLKNGLSNPCNRCGIATEALRRRAGLPGQMWEDLDEGMSKDYCPEGKKINVKGRWMIKG